MREPNIFRALSIERREVRHSNFLAYLLDPQENHGLRDIVLRKFLKDIFSDKKAQERTIYDADGLDLSLVEIRREWRHIDLLIVLPGDVIAIENKVDSGEHSNQLLRYQSTVSNSFHGKKRHFVFLTPFGTEPERAEDQETYINYSYSQVAEILATILDLYHESLGDRVKVYLSDYLTTVRRELLMSDKLNELAVKVYRNHKAAFDFILENRPDPAIELYPYFENALKDAGFKIGSKNKGSVRFATEGVMSKLPNTGIGWPGKEQFLMEIEYFWTDKYANVKATIAPGDEVVRATLLKAVRGLKGTKEPSGRKWLVFYSKKFPFVASEVMNEDEAEIEKRVKRIVSAIEHDAMDICVAIEHALGNVT